MLDLTTQLHCTMLEFGQIHCIKRIVGLNNSEAQLLVRIWPNLLYQKGMLDWITQIHLLEFGQIHFHKTKCLTKIENRAQLFKDNDVVS